MFEVGFTELLLISVIALIVLGPERLPKLVGQVGRWVGKARSMARSFREQLESEVNLEEMTRTTPRSPPPASSTPDYPPPGEAPPNDPTMSDSLSTAHLTPAEQEAADTAHHPTSDYPYDAPSYHPEADVYAGTSTPAPEVLTPEEGAAPAVEEAAPGGPEEPVRLHDHQRV